MTAPLNSSRPVDDRSEDPGASPGSSPPPAPDDNSRDGPPPRPGASPTGTSPTGASPKGGDRKAANEPPGGTSSPDAPDPSDAPDGNGPVDDGTRSNRTRSNRARSNRTRDESTSEEEAAGEEAEDAPAEDAPAEDGRRTTLGTVQEPQRLHPLTMALRVLASLPALLLLLIPTLQNPSSQNFLSLGMMILYGVLALPAIVLQYLRFSYRITPKQIVIQQGVFNRQNRSIPIERVQNIQIERNLLARIARIAKVKIETAGSSGTEGTLEYVGYDQAQDIRRLIRSIQKEQKTGPEESASDEPAAAGEDGSAANLPAAEAAADAGAETLFTMSLPQVLQSGAFRFSLLYIALVFSVLQFIEPDVLLNWLLVSQGEIAGLTETALQHPGLAVLGTVVIAAVLGWISGILVHLNRYYGFTLWLEDGKLRKRHGLFTVSEGTIPLSKVQTLILKTNPMMRAFGFFELEVQTVGVDVNEQGHRVIAPFATRSRILELAQQVRVFELPDAFASVSPLTIRRTFVRYTTALTVAAATAAYFWPAGWVRPMDLALPWWSLAFIPLIAVYAWFEYRNHGYRVQDDGFYVRRGVFSHSIWVIPTEKYHVFTRRATLFQQRLGLQTLYVDTAGAASFAYPDVVDLTVADAHTQLSALHNRFQTLYRSRIEEATGDAQARLSAEERPQLPDPMDGPDAVDA